MSLTTVPDGQIATIVTHLEMRERPRPAPMPPTPLRLVPWKTPTPDAYRALFRRVGEPWLWFSRLMMDDAALTAIIHDPAVEVYAVTDPRGVEVGLLELDFRSLPDCELAFFGLIPTLNGKGLGKWLIAQAKTLAWRKDVMRFWVHSCTLDSPAALGFYQKAGFVPTKREVEIFADPRLAGLLPPDAAPHVPMLGQSATA
ncbi:MULTISPECIES: GNAT family N-acetyltransferase [unclassified Sphingobium]|uniref:GNAT family N-acetyltransferase n=1 Tax=unclassified Sphingobium TaxID=2611147 RepID=UPI00076FFA58|nr:MULTISPECIES: GNAT family N-acetyltransferase [unclassified Sphingobium]AMK22053.1 N-acetyltransferase GCN5 [Sphingobium sp. TKS]NML88088.1 GNAT family N-acetyltransferase [Sphingobium sp. TB-6]